MGGTFSAFQTLCSRLQDNDPNVFIVNTDTFPYFDPEAAQKLGQALENNTHVQRLIIDITNLAVLGPEDGVTRISSFVKTSQSLKAVLLKSPGLASFGEYIGPNQRIDVADVVTIFLSSLAQNEAVDEVILADVDLALPCKAFHKFLVECKPNLRRLRLSYGQGLEPIEMMTIMDAFAKNETLKEVQLTEVPESMWSACLAGIAVNQNLCSLNLDRLSEDYDHTPLNNVIETNTSIRKLSITRSRFVSVESIITSLQRNETIVELILSNCGIGVHDAVHLKRLVKECPSITRLNLSGNTLRARGLQLLAEGLFRNRSLSLLDVSDNELEGRDSARTLGNLLRRNRALSRLDVDRNNWAAPSGMRACAEGLARNAKVMSLDMSGSRLNSQAMTIFADVGLRHNRSLQVLFLNSNYVSLAGLHVLLEALEEANTVHSLSLNDNNLNATAGLLLAQSLRNVSCPLQRLLLNSNNLGGEGIRAIMEALETNKRLECLGFEENIFEKDTMDALCRTLRINSTLKQVCFTFHNQEWTTEWYDTLRANRGLTNIKTPGVALGSPFIEAELDFYVWRNLCRPLMMRSSILDGLWARTLFRLSQMSKQSAVYHVLREQLPSGCCEVSVGRKRRALSPYR